MDEMEMIDIMKKHEEQELRKSESKLDKAKRRKAYWREWRRNEDILERSDESEELRDSEGTLGDVGEEGEKRRLIEMRNRTREMMSKRRNWEQEKKVKSNKPNESQIMAEKEQAITENPQLESQSDAQPYNNDKDEEEKKVGVEIDELDEEIDDWSVEMEWMRTEKMCLDCAHFPCLCSLLKVELKIQELLKNPVKMKQEDYQGNLEEGRKEETIEEDQDMPQEKGTINNIKGGSPRGLAFRKTGPC